MLFPNDEKSKFANDSEYRRLAAPFLDESDRFRYQATNDYSKQFAHIYSARLEQMRSLLTDRCVQKWGLFFFLAKSI